MVWVIFKEQIPLGDIGTGTGWAGGGWVEISVSFEEHIRGVTVHHPL